MVSSRSAPRAARRSPRRSPFRPTSMNLTFKESVGRTTCMTVCPPAVCIPMRSAPSVAAVTTAAATINLDFMVLLSDRPDSSRTGVWRGLAATSRLDPYGVEDGTHLGDVLRGRIGGPFGRDHQSAAVDVEDPELFCVAGTRVAIERVPRIGLREWIDPALELPADASGEAAVIPAALHRQVWHGQLQMLTAVAVDGDVGRRRRHPERSQIRQRGGEVIDTRADRRIGPGMIATAMTHEVRHGGDAHSDISSTGSLERPNPLRPAIGCHLVHDSRA